MHGRQRRAREPRRVAMPAFATRLQYRRVPQRVQVGAAAIDAYLASVAAAVAAITRVQRLVHVGDEMHEEAQGLCTLSVGSRTVAEHVRVTFDRAYRAAATRTIEPRDVTAIRVREIHEMQACGRAPECASARVVTQVVGPVRDVGKLAVVGECEQRAYLGMTLTLANAK